MVDMKVQVSSNFSKKILEKNEISKLHEEWNISSSQVQGQGSKNGSFVHPFSQNAIPHLETPKIKNKKTQKIGKNEGQQGLARSLINYRPRLAGNCWLLANRMIRGGWQRAFAYRSYASAQNLSPLPPPCKSFLLLPAHLFLHI